MTMKYVTRDRIGERSQMGDNLDETWIMQYPSWHLCQIIK